ncbi:MAG TPA: A/G-specific adenine glycosylase, partial [Burkholderiales bacterium]|nr:A/G-specific adenine glycosylase [Burkholderiales bacterium]
IMLQQTQVGTVVPYYRRFRARFPDVASLAAADEDEVLRLWSGLGYYSRARNLHRAAQAIVAEHGGAFPRELGEIEALPGIGRSTAAAIAGFAYGARAAILDGNVKRVLARYFAVDGYPGERAVEQRLWQLAEALLPAADIEPYIQGLMDLGATVCTTRAPQCGRCPVQESCAAFAQNRLAALPAPRPRRAVPHRRTSMLVLRSGGDVLLQKRPSAGVWSGLWSFPEMGADEDPARIAMRTYGCEIGSVERLGMLRHGFTHFTLDIDPVVVRVRRVAPRAAQPGVLWMPLEEAIGAAVPVPVRKLLRALAGSALADQPALLEEAVEDLEAR